MSGVSTHLNLLFASSLAQEYELDHFQVGSEGRTEGRVMFALRVLFSPLQFAAHLLFHRPDLVHLNTSFDQKGFWRDLVYLIIARSLFLRVVYQIHGGGPPQDLFGNNRLLHAVLRSTMRLASVVVVLATYELSAHREFTPDAHFVMIPNAIVPVDADVSPARYAAPRPLRVLYLGRLADHKGIDDLVKAAALLRKADVPFGVTIAGAGEERARLESLIRSEALESCVSMPGPVFGAEKDELWRTSDVFVMPTRAKEGMPYSLLEAMSAGAVPVACCQGGMADAMQEGVNSLAVPTYDPAAIAAAITKLSADRDLLARMARAGRQRILDDFSVTRLARDFSALYARVLSGAAVSVEST